MKLNKIAYKLFLVLLMMYVAGALSQATFNLTKWSGDSRAVVACFWIVFSFIIIQMEYLDSSDKKA